MPVLRRTIICISVLAVLQLMKAGLDRFSPMTSPFHRTATSALQLCLFIWLLLYLLLVAFRARQPLKKAFVVLVTVLLAGELLCIYLITHPGRIPRSFLSAFRYYYDTRQRNIIQYDPGCAVYDPQLFYTLAPNARFRFSNMEFSDSFYTNRMGLRDDDLSLAQPSVVVLGDSYAMGWGVEQDETFAERVAQATGRNVLNGGVSSYGTARELALYKKLGVAPEYLVIQYSRNDAIENGQYLKNNRELRISSKASYDSVAAILRWNRAWFPGKYFLTILRNEVTRPFKQRSLANAPAINPEYFVFDPRIEAEKFLGMILPCVDFKQTTVLVVDLNAAREMDDRFIDQLDAISSSGQFRELTNGRLHAIRMSGKINSSDYYILDDHLRASGHEHVAVELLKYIH